MFVYDFDAVYPRTNSEKWMELDQRFGATDLVALWEADMDFRSAQPIVEALIERASEGIYGYVHKPASYNEAITAWYRDRHNFLIESEWLLHAPMAMAAVVIFLRLFTRPGDGIAIQTPAYYPFYGVIEGAGRTIVRNPLIYRDGKYEMDLENLEQAFKLGAKVFVLCNPQNPGGRVWTTAELRAVGDLCRRYGAKVIADEVHADLCRRDHRYVAYSSVAPEFRDASMTLLSPGKTFNLAGIHQAVAIIPDPDLREPFASEISLLEIEKNNCFSTVAVEAGYRHGGGWLDQALAYIEGNLLYADDFFRTRVPEIGATVPEGTYLMWLDCRGLNMNAMELERFMVEEAKVGLGEGYWFGPEGEGFERLNVACPRATLAEGLERIERAVTRRRHH